MTHYRLPLGLGLWLLSLAAAQGQTSSSITLPEYIERYKDIAVQEMERSGVPASIKLAQGIHESAFGNSTLAKEANNHFGIKCGSDWKGQTFFRWDDEMQESCFRVYESPLESYIAHTDFLRNRKHYNFLFSYSRTDYKNWARGLQRAKYATDPKYPDKLIDLIERHRLHRFDSLTGSITFQPPVQPSEPKPSEVFIRETDKKRTKPRSFLFSEYRKGIFRQNEASYVVAKQGESALELAARFDIPYARFLRFNDMEDGDLLMTYQYAYIQPKRTTYRGDSAWHQVKQDETMYEIAQFYGIRLSNLLELNRLKPGQEPANGEYVQLKERAVSPPRLRATNHVDALPPLVLEAPGLDSQALFPPRVQPEPPAPAPLRIDQPTYNEAIYTPQQPLNTAKDSVLPAPAPIRVVPPTRSDWQDRPSERELPLTPAAPRPAPSPAPARPSSGSPAPNPFEETPPTSNSPFDQNFKPGYNPPIAVPPAPAKPQAPAAKTHKVVSGDSLGRIAARYGVSIQALRQANDLQGDLIKIGQVLKIP